MGSVYRPKGRKPGTPFYLKYREGGKDKVVTSGTADYAEACARLKSIEGKIAEGLPVPVGRKQRVTWAEACDTIVADYVAQERRSISGLRGRITKHLTPAFGIDPKRDVLTITATEITAYRDGLLRSGYSRAEVHRHLSILRRMFRLLWKLERLPMLKHVPMITKWDNARRGFFERDEFDAVLEHLPEYMQLPCEFAYWCGWRFHDEVLSLTWDQVDRRNQTVRLDDSKNGEGREVTYGDLPVLVDVFERAWRRHQAHKLAGRTQNVAARLATCEQHNAARRARYTAPLVFTNDEGKELVRYSRRGELHGMPEVYRHWRTATDAAGVRGRYFHDLRRTAARNMIHARVPEAHAMKVLGHKTVGIFRRYNIVDREDMRNAMRALASTPGGSSMAARGKSA